LNIDGGFRKTVEKTEKRQNERRAGSHCAINECGLTSEGQRRALLNKGKKVGNKEIPRESRNSCVRKTPAGAQGGVGLHILFFPRPPCPNPLADPDMY